MIINLLMMSPTVTDEMFATLDTWKPYVSNIYIQLNDPRAEYPPSPYIFKTKFKDFATNRNELIEKVVKEHKNCYIIFIDDSYELTEPFDFQSLTERFYSVKIKNEHIVQHRCIVQKVNNGNYVPYRGDYHEKLLTTELHTKAPFEIYDRQYEHHNKRRLLRSMPNSSTYLKLINKLKQKDISYVSKNYKKLEDRGQAYMVLSALAEIDFDNAIAWYTTAGLYARSNECYFKIYLLTKDEKYLKFISDFNEPQDNIPYSIELYRQLKEHENKISIV